MKEEAEIVPAYLKPRISLTFTTRLGGKGKFYYDYLRTRKYLKDC